MSQPHTQPGYRVISIIAILQVGVIVGGTLFVAAMLKAAGYRGGVVPDAYFNTGALFIRDSGFTLLLLPAAWALVAVFATRVAAQQWMPALLYLIGIAAIILGLIFYLIIASNPTI